jgi:hypothetical protein
LAAIKKLLSRKVPKGDRRRMILFLRDQNNDTVVDVELYQTENHIELHSSVILEAYSKILLSVKIEEINNVITDFNTLQELRGWLWENYFGGQNKNTTQEYSKILEIVRNKLKTVGIKYGLYYVED